MMKKIISLLLAIIPLVTSAQLVEGNWKIYKTFNTISLYPNDVWSGKGFIGYRLVETPSKVYFCVNGTLSSLDKQTNQMYTYTANNKLSDNYVNGVWYNPQGQYLLIAYNNGNIDALYDDGSVVNLPNIKDAIMTVDKLIYDVAFDGDNAYVGTSFGLVVFNVPGAYLVDSGIYNVKITSVAIVDGKIVVHVGYGPYEIRYIDPAAKSISSWSNFTSFSGGYYGNNLRHLTGNKLLARRNKSGVGYIPVIYTLNFSNNTIAVQELVSDAVDYFQKDAAGNYYVENSAGNKIHKINVDGSVNTVNIPSNAQGNVITYWNDMSDAWIAGDGIAQMSILSEPAVVKKDFVKPNIPAVKRAWLMDMTTSGKLVMADLGISDIYEPNYGLFRGEFGYVNLFDGEKFEDLMPLPLSNPYYGLIGYYDVLAATEDPDDPSVFYISNFWSGLDKVKKGEDGKWHDIFRYTSANAPIYDYANWGQRFGQVRFDKFGNMWTFQPCKGDPTESDPNIIILPAEARGKTTDLKRDDWRKLVVRGFNTNRDCFFLMCEKSNMIFIVDTQWPTAMIAYDTKGTATFDDDEWRLWRGDSGDGASIIKDQNGDPFHMERFYCMAEDKDGRVWIGTHTGVLEITDPSQALDPEMRFKHLTVPRTDGSGFADVLLDTQQVSSIAVDEHNNKWLGTRASGLYYVSADGDKVYNNYTTSNSALLDDMIYRVAYFPARQSVFVSTPYGINELSHVVPPSADDFSNVYAYPNPVKPDYTGWITIRGLMDNSHVVIKDAAGAVYLDTTSDGGVVTWDGCDANGQRVKSGVYRVEASKGAEPLATVTKIMVVK